MAYKPVPTTQKICVHCNTLYYAKDKRRLYCSSSCNTLAWMARHGLSGHDQPQAKPKQATGDLDLSLNNLLVVGGGTLAADGVKALFDTQPTNREVIERMAQLDKDVENGLKQINRGTQHLIDGINALMATNPLAAQEFNRIQEAKQLEQARLANRQDIVDRILAKRNLPRQLGGR